MNHELNGMTDVEVENFLKYNQFIKFRKLQDGEWIGMLQLAFTMSVCCGITLHDCFKYRWCFENPDEALEFFNACQNYDDIPAKRESLKGHRYLTKPRIVEYDEYGFEKW